MDLLRRKKLGFAALAGLGLAFFGCGEEEGREGDLVAIAPPTFASLDHLSACRGAGDTNAASDGLPSVVVEEERAFTLTVSAEVEEIERGRLRAQVEALRTEGETITFPLVPAGDRHEGTVALSWPELGTASFAIRVAGEEVAATVRLEEAEKELRLERGELAGNLLTLEARVSCGGEAMGGHTVRFRALPEAPLLPSEGETGSDGSLAVTLELPQEAEGRVRVEAVSGSASVGCVIDGTGDFVGSCGREEGGEAAAR